MRMLFVLRLYMIVVLCAFVPSIHAQEAQLPDDYKATVDMTLNEQMHFKSIAGQLRCPTCTGLSVLDSDAPFSLQIQALVKEQIKNGKTEAHILTYFTDRYGPWILREPPREGVNLLAWMFPLCLMLLGPLGVWVFVWRKKQSTNIATGINVRSSDLIIAEFDRSVAAVRQSQGGV